LYFNLESSRWLLVRLQNSIPELKKKINQRQSQLKDLAGSNKDVDKILSNDSTFTLEIPTIWQRTANAPEATLLAYNSPIENAGIICTYADVSEEEDTDIDQVMTKLCDEVDQKNGSIFIERRDNVVIDNFPAERAVIKLNINKVDMYALLTIVNCEDTYYVLFGICRYSDKEKVGPKISKIEDSFIYLNNDN